MVKHNKMLLLSAVLCVLILLSGCQQATEPTVSPEPEVKVLTIGTPYSIETLSPYKYSSDGDRYVISQIMESLIEANAGHYYPLLAESWTNPDPLTWDFKLRENAFWQEGNAVYAEGAHVQVKAEDVKACFDFALDPANGAMRQAELFNTIERVEVVDAFTVRFVTKEPNAFFLQTVNRLPIFSLKALDVLGEDDFAFTPIGTGAYKFVEYRTDEMVLLEKNDQYCIQPNLDQVVFRIIPDKSVAAIALQTGEVDIVLQISPTDVETVRQVEGLTTMPNSYGWYRYVAFDVSNPLFEDVRVREAFSLAIDMSLAVDSIFEIEGLALRAPGPVPKGIPGYSDTWFDLWTYDVDAAKTLLAEAGWTLGSDGILEKDGQKMSFVLKTPNDVNRSKLGVIVATQLKAIGVDCRPQPQEWATHLSDIRAGNVEMFIMGGGSSVDGLRYMFHSTMGSDSHNTNYENAQLDALLEEASRTLDPEAREVLLEQAARFIVEDKVHISAYYEYVQIGLNEQVKDFDPPSVWLALTSSSRNVDIVK